LAPYQPVPVWNPAIEVIQPRGEAHTGQQGTRSSDTNDLRRVDVHKPRGRNHLIAGPLENVRGVTCMDIETRLQNVAKVIAEIDDSKVPRNIRRQAKEVTEQWLLNTAKKTDVRVAMTQAKLEELYEDPNIPPEFGTLILMINTELEKLLTELL